LTAVKPGGAAAAYLAIRPCPLLEPRIMSTPHDSSPSAASAADTPEPIAGFSRCHEGILQHLDALAGLPALLVAATRARDIAAGTLRFFRDVVLEHHQEEERELFPAVLASAAPGTERDQVRAIIEQLTQEHREVEAAFVALEPDLKHIAKGHDTALAASEFDAQVRLLITRYQGHASFEETDFLPMSERILGRNSNHMAALGLSLHMRHALPEVLQHYGSRI
jgi:hypothetical protein